MTPLRPLTTCLALTITLAAATAQDIAPKDSERDPMLSALTEGFEDEDIPSVTVDISATDSALIGEEAPEAVSEEGDSPESVEEAAVEAPEEEEPPAPRNPKASP